MSELLKKLYKYAPRLVLEHIVKNQAPPEHPVAHTIVGAALFADMAGFTSLTERIMKISANGLNELADIVNLYLSRQIDIIDNYGGDILKFAGDALIAVWPASTKMELARMTLRAAHCGVEIQRRLDRTKIGSGMELSLRIGVGAGPMISQMVGGLYDRWEFLIGGDAVDQVGRAQKMAEPGQVVISPQGARMIRFLKAGHREGNRFLIEHRPEASPPGPLAIPELSADGEKALRCFIPRRIINLIEEGRAANAVEVRTVTVLFIRILEWHTAELPIEKVHLVMRTVQDGLYRHEGAINRFGIEEKGTVILAAFGLPPLDHPDDAIRALLSARDIVTELGEIGHKAVIGIATGFVFVGPMGNEIRSEYTMHGNVVNLAARLMQASDSIYCDQATYEKVLALTGGDPVAAHGLRFEALAPMKVKGHDKPVNAYRLQIP
jgi:class 3 adenylate cyclase